VVLTFFIIFFLFFMTMCCYFAVCAVVSKPFYICITHDILNFGLFDVIFNIVFNIIFGITWIL